MHQSILLNWSITNTCRWQFGIWHIKNKACQSWRSCFTSASPHLWNRLQYTLRATRTVGSSFWLREIILKTIENNTFILFILSSVDWKHICFKNVLLWFSVPINSTFLGVLYIISLLLVLWKSCDASLSRAKKWRNINAFPVFILFKTTKIN